MRNKGANEKKSFISKVIFFISILIVVAISFFESMRIEDLIYFILVFILFIRYLIVKLYH